MYTRAPTEPFKTVYYSQFWYTRYFQQKLSSFDGNPRSEIKTHQYHLRLLALFFPQIYIPRTHLITQAFATQSVVPKALFDTEEFRFLSEVGTLRISTFPGLDAKEDNERIIARSSETSAVWYESSVDYLRAIPNTVKVEIASHRESISNLVTFPQYADHLSAVDSAIADRLKRIIADSNLRDVPFFHEAFVRKLRAEFDEETFSKIWRDTNSIYLVTGVPSQNGGIPYFNEQIESSGFRFEPCDLDRYLFNPSSLYTFLLLMLEMKEMKKFLDGPIQRTLSLLTGQHTQILEGLRRTYFEIVQDVSLYTSQPALRSSFDLPTIGTLQHHALNNTLQSQISAIENAIADARAIAGAAQSQTAGFALSLAQPALRYGRKQVESLARRFRYPELSSSIRAIKSALAEIG